MDKAKTLFEEAKEQPTKDSLAEHVATIKILRKKHYSWREVAEFLNSNGVNTDHTKVFRFVKNLATNKNNYINFFVPTSEQYVQALQEIAMTGKQRKMLLFHYSAHNRTVTYTELADAASFDGYKTANLQYGKLGRSLGEELEMIFATSGKTGEHFYSSAIGADNPFRSAEQDYELVMHHELAKAIEALGWPKD